MSWPATSVWHRCSLCRQGSRCTSSSGGSTGQNHHSGRDVGGGFIGPEWTDVHAGPVARALVVLLREGESACSQAAFDVGANRCSQDELNALADAVTQYRHMGAM